jgi:hypothetical protein
MLKEKMMVKDRIQDMVFTTSPPAELGLNSQTYVCYEWPVCMSKETITFCAYGG